MKRKTTPLLDTKAVARFALDNCEEHKDPLGEINLTALGEAAQDHFNLSDEQYNHLDVDWYIYSALDNRGLLRD